MMTTLDITLSEAAWTDLVASPETTVDDAVAAVFQAMPEKDSADQDVSVVLASAGEVKALNTAYRQKHAPTNVLAFPADIPAGLECGRPLGDIILSFETVRDEAAAQGKPPANHLSHLVVHGLLHLLGFDHDTEAEADIMETWERRILMGLGIPDPYGAPALNEHAGGSLK